MKLTAKLKILANHGQAAALKETLERANLCCNWLSEQAWENKTFVRFALHTMCYKQARQRFGLSSQITIRAIAKVVGSYRQSRKTLSRFRRHGAFPYDSRLLTYRDSTISIWTVMGRLKAVALVCGRGQTVLMYKQQGESLLLLRNGVFYLVAVCNVDTPKPVDVSEFLGVDFGLKKIAATSDGRVFSGTHVTNVRCRRTRHRRKLLACGSRSAKRHLKRLAGKERAFATDTNHVISKQIVAEAKRTGRGLAIENLAGIRDRIRAGRKQRALLHSWAFYQLRLFITYKAALAGIPLVAVDPRNTSRECSQCHYVSKLNRPTQSKFACLSCGHSENADINAAKNIAGRALANAPIAARTL